MAKNNLSISPCCVPCRLSAFELNNLSFASNGNSWKVLYAEACLQPMWRSHAIKRAIEAFDECKAGRKERSDRASTHDAKPPDNFLEEMAPNIAPKSFVVL